MSTVVCHLFVVRIPERSAVCSQALCAVSGEPSANSERPSWNDFSLDSRQQEMLFQLITRPFQRFFFIGQKLTSNKAHKVGLVTVVSLGVVSGEASANANNVTESFLFRFSPTSQQLGKN